LQEIAFFIYCLNGRGQSKVMSDIAGGLAQKGYKVTFFYTKLDNDIFIKRYKDLVEFKKINSAGRFKSVLELRKIIKKNEFDVFFTAGNDNNCSVVLARYNLKINTKFIITEHNALSQVIANSKKPFIGVLRIFVKLLYKHSDVLVSVSNGIKNELDQEIKVNHKKSIVIYNPVVDDYLKALSLEQVEHEWLNSDKKVFLGVGRLSIQKNFELLIKAFKLISDKDTYRLIILGDGDDREGLQRLIRELDLMDKVELYGRTDNPYAFMRNANCFVLSSKFEGLPTVLIEALACNLPIVSTNCPHGASEILEDGKWGRLVPVNDEKALALAMEATINEPKKNLEKRANAFTYDKSIQEYEALLNNLSES